MTIQAPILTSNEVNVFPDPDFKAPYLCKKKVQKGSLDFQQPEIAKKKNPKLRP